MWHFKKLLPKSSNVKGHTASILSSRRYNGKKRRQGPYQLLSSLFTDAGMNRLAHQTPLAGTRKVRERYGRAYGSFRTEMSLAQDGHRLVILINSFLRSIYYSTNIIHDIHSCHLYWIRSPSNSISERHVLANPSSEPESACSLISSSLLASDSHQNGQISLV